MPDIAPGSTDLLFPNSPIANADPYSIHTYYFGFNIPEASIGVYIYLRAQAGLGLCQGGVVVYRGLDNLFLLDAEYHDYRITMPWPTLDGSAIKVPNGLVIDWILPGEHARLTYRSPRGDVHFEIDQRAISPLVARGYLVPGEQDHHNGAGEPGGSVQIMRATGLMSLRGEALPVDSITVRDRSWNQVRTEEPGGARPTPPRGWTPISFGHDFSLSVSSVEPADTKPAWLGICDPPNEADSTVNAWVFRGGVLRRIVSIRRNVLEYHPLLLAAQRQEVEAVDEDGCAYKFTGEAIAMSVMDAWPNAFFCDSVYRWTDESGQVTHCTYQEMFHDRYMRGRRERERSNSVVAG